MFIMSASQKWLINAEKCDSFCIWERGTGDSTEYDVVCRLPSGSEILLAYSTREKAEEAFNKLADELGAIEIMEENDANA